MGGESEPSEDGTADDELRVVGAKDVVVGLLLESGEAVRVPDDPERLPTLNCLALTLACVEDVAIAAEVSAGAALEETLKLIVASGAAFCMLVGITTGQKLHTSRPTDIWCQQLLKLNERLEPGWFHELQSPDTPTIW